jgi:hypothetical protein
LRKQGSRLFSTARVCPTRTVCLSACLYVSLSVCLFVCLSVCFPQELGTTLWSKTRRFALDGRRLLNQGPRHPRTVCESACFVSPGALLVPRGVGAQSRVFPGDGLLSGCSNVLSCLVLGF